MTDISETIIRLRTEKGWTQQDLADRLFVSRSLVAMWELGTREPDVLTVERMAEFFEVNVGDVIPDRRFVYFSFEEYETIKEEINEITKIDSFGDETRERQASVLNNFLSHLNRKNRIIFASRYLLMKTCKAIGNELGMSETSVRTRLFRLRNELKDFVRRLKNGTE
jgi:transcriptional regulator with XRE-family HTH domain